MFEPAENFPRDRLAAVTPVLRGDLNVLIPSQKGHDAAGMKVGCVGRIDQKLIHGDRSHLRETLVAMERVNLPTQGSHNTVGIADGNHSKASGMGADVLMAIAHASAGLDFADQRDLGAYR